MENPQQVSRLAWDTHHEAMYCMGRFCTYDEFEKLAKTYEKADNICQDNINGRSTIEKLVCVLIRNMELVRIGGTSGMHNQKSG